MKSELRRLLPVITALALLCTAASKAAEPMMAVDEAAEAISLLKQEIRLINDMKYYATTVSKGQLFFLSKSSEDVIKAIETSGPDELDEKTGKPTGRKVPSVGNDEVTEAFRAHITRYDLSISSLTSLPKCTEAAAVKLRETHEKIKAKRKFKVKGTIILTTVQRMHELLFGPIIEQQGLSEDVKKQIRSLNSQFAGLEATADADGDLTITGLRAIELYDNVKALYQNLMLPSKSATDSVLEFMGANEFLGQFSTADQVKRVQEDQKKRK